MKKLILFGISYLVVMLLVFFGPDLLDLYRLHHFIDASAEAYQPMAVRGRTSPMPASAAMASTATRNTKAIRAWRASPRRTWRPSFASSPTASESIRPWARWP